MEIPILITGYTATDCFGRMASGASKLEAVHLMKRMHARDERAENLTSISVQSIHPMAFNKPKTAADGGGASLGSGIRC